MPVTIIMPDWAKFTEWQCTMCGAPAAENVPCICAQGRDNRQRKDDMMTNTQAALDAAAYAEQDRARQQGLGQPVRTIATVAAELGVAIRASKRANELRGELDELLGRKRRARKAKP